MKVQKQVLVQELLCGYRQVGEISRRELAGFTLVEIALALAVIGFALVAIIGVLPLGMNVQRENREETIINHDALVLLEVVRTGANGFDELTNYVQAAWLSNVIVRVNIYDGGKTEIGRQVIPIKINSARELVGLLNTPTTLRTDQLPSGILFVTNRYAVVHMRALTGVAVDKPPQVNQTIIAGAFSYKLEGQLLPCFAPDVTRVSRYPIPNLYELRLTFRWPLLPNGKTGRGLQRFNTRISGTLSGPFYLRQQFPVPFYFFEPDVFVQPIQPVEP